MTTGQRIKSERLKAGLTQKELGKRLGIAYQSVAQWENGLRNPKLETLQRIADALNVSLWTFFPDGTEVTFDGELFRVSDGNAVRWIGSPAGQGDSPQGAENQPANDNRARLNANYDSLNDHSRKRLVEYSDDLVSNPQNRRDPDNE